MSGLSYASCEQIQKNMFLSFSARIVGYIILMPIIFWIVANIEGIIVHHYVPELVNYKFSFTR